MVGYRQFIVGYFLFMIVFLTKSLGEADAIA